MKKLYYVVERDLFDFDDIQETTGVKNVRVYTIENGELQNWFNLELINSDITLEEIKDYLNDNGYETNNLKMIQLWKKSGQN